MGTSTRIADDAGRYRRSDAIGNSLTRRSLIALGLGVLAACSNRDDAGSGKALVGGPFALTDQDGAPRTEQSWPGKYLLIYFGYTFCPDVCPIDLQRTAAALKILEEQAPATLDKIQPIFVTIDPERDTPDVMKAYVTAFGPRFVGLTGTVAQIDAAKKAYRVFSQKRQDAGSSDYLMDHSSVTYLMAPNGDYVTVFGSETKAQVMADTLKAKVE